MLNNQAIDQMGRVFANGPRDQGSIPGRVIPKTQEMVFDASLTLCIIRYGSKIKWSNPGKGVAPPKKTLVQQLLKKEPLGHPRLWSPTLLLLYTLNDTKIQLDSGARNSKADLAYSPSPSLSIPCYLLQISYCPSDQ